MMRLWVLLAAALAGAAGCAKREAEAGGGFAVNAPETAVTYEVAVEGAPDDQTEAVLQSALALIRRQDRGAASLAFLRRRAEGDVDVARRVLRSGGWFAPTITTAVEAPPEPDAPALARVVIDPGPRFTLTGHDLDIATPDVPPALNAQALGSPVGGPAEAAGILAAEAAAVEALREAGFPYAVAAGRDATADMDAATIQVTTRIDAGRAYVSGAVEVAGTERVKPDHIRTYTTFDAGTAWRDSDADAYQQALAATGLFDVVSVAAPAEPPEGDAAPVVVTVEEGLRRTISLGARFSTDAGPAVRALFEHRNLFGAGERGAAEALVGLEEQRLELGYLEPQFGRPGQDLRAGLSLRHVEDDALEETAATLTLGLERQLNPALRVGAGGLLEFSDVADAEGTRQFLLAGLPAFADYDATDDRLAPTEGARARVELTPFAGQADAGPDPLFVSADATASTYRALDESRDYVLAGRARLGSIVASDATGVPSNRRLFAGGEGSVRAFARRGLGASDLNGEPVGGLSVIELGAELRAYPFDPFGLVAFVEAGLVGEESLPDFEQEPQAGAGLGFRYRSPVGPIRVDVAVPLNPRTEDDAFQLYISVGEAF